MTPRTWKVAGLLFFSGACALVYQTVWLRQFRLVFGASTWATAAVLAIFMAGLGAGSALLGRRADAKEHPLGWYGRLELLIAAAAAISPLLVWLVAKIYFASGGGPALGITGATLLRLLLATVVLGPPTLLMGGTLPAASRAVGTAQDAGRRSVALLYGINTLGAVAGTLVSTFFLLERLGNRATLLLAVAVNLVVALTALAMSRGGGWQSTVGDGRENEGDGQALPSREPDLPSPLENTVPRQPATVDRRLVYAASAIAGFSFLLMELVWYRMLSPILGGTTYMFGLVLAVALAGIGLGGAAYAWRENRSPTIAAFALTSGLEALAMAVPFALGDRLAVLANVLRGLGVLGFGGYTAGWALVTVIVVFPAAFVSGVQFPLLIALLGKGREDVGRHVGAAYAWNTAGAIAGSLAGGFGLLPLLTAPTTWRVVAAILAVVAVAAAAYAVRPGSPVRSFLLSGATAIVALIAVVCLTATGPTAVWRHSGIGAARAPSLESRNAQERWVTEVKLNVLWDRDGRESSVAAVIANDLSFVVNGKSDGAARGDAETQVMLGLIPAAIHPAPKRALVVGLGTGESAGWLGAIPSMERVDVVELEPVVLDIARACAPVNAGAMTNPKVHISIGDAREVLLTSDATYDLIASEPSNPYRAGIASLLTREFYEAARSRLAPGGLLAQWVQSYSIHSDTMRTIYATLTSVFPHVQTWWTTTGDLVLVASAQPITIDAAALRARLQSEPFREAVFNVWRSTTAEFFLARMFANEDFARAAAAEATELNSDDRTVIEFGFARSLDESVQSLHRRIADDAAARRADRPLAVRGDVDWELVSRNRPWKVDKLRPTNLGQLALSAMEMAERGDARAEAHAEVVRRGNAVEGDVILALLRARQKRHDEAAAILIRALHGFRRDPWPQQEVAQKAVSLAIELARTSTANARTMHEGLSQPFAMYQQAMGRRLALIIVAPLFDACGAKTLDALRAVEPHPFWNEEVLTIRANCYAIARDERAERAWADLDRYRESEQSPVLKPKAR